EEMKRQQAPWVIALLMVLMPAAACPALGTRPAASPAAPDGVTVAASPTAAPAATQPAASPTAPGIPTALGSSTAAATVAASQPAAPTPDQGTDICTLMELGFLNANAGDSFITKQSGGQPGGYAECIAVGAQGTTAVLAAAQGDLATNILASEYAAIQGASGCDWSSLQQGDADAVAQVRADLGKKYAPDQLLAGVLKETAAVAASKGCADATGWIVIPNLGDVAVADHAFGAAEVRMVSGPTLLGVTIQKTGDTPAQELPIEEKWMAAILAAAVTH